jgi:hypothetical protein
MRRQILDGVSSRAILTNWCGVRVRGLATKLSEPTRASSSHVIVFRVHPSPRSTHVRPRLSNMSQLILIRTHPLSPVWYVPAQDIRILLIHFTQRRRCSHLGHTYCSSCVEKLVDDDIDETSTCPECRTDFEFEDIRPLYLKPSNNSSGSQTSSRHDSSSADQDGYIKQANHIARRLQRLNTKSPAESVKNAADVIEQVATIQCKAAQVCPLSLNSHNIVFNISTGDYLESRTSVLDEPGYRLRKAG